MKMMLSIILVALPALVSATFGVDVSQYIDAFSCMKKDGYTFAIIRGYQSYGHVDPNVVSNIRNARSAGMSAVDVYMFPCVPCGNPSTQVDDLVNAIKGENYGMIWVDIERYAWKSNKDENQAFFEGLISRLEHFGKSVGVYSSYYNWEDIMGLGYTGGAHLPLWYAHYDNNPSFSDFSSFGGWSRPSIKQYKGDTTLCGKGVDLNYY